MSSTVNHSDLVNLSLDICQDMQDSGLTCTFSPRQSGIDTIVLSMSHFSADTLTRFAKLAQKYKILILRWVVQGEFRADRIFTVFLYVTQIRSNGNG